MVRLVPRKKRLALAGNLKHSVVMEEAVLEARKLRPELVQRIEAMDDASLLLLHHLVLHVEKEQLWHELSAEAEADRRSGKLDRLPEIIRASRHPVVSLPDRQGRP